LASLESLTQEQMIAFSKLDELLQNDGHKLAQGVFDDSIVKIKAKCKDGKQQPVLCSMCQSKPPKIKKAGSKRKSEKVTKPESSKARKTQSSEHVSSIRNLLEERRRNRCKEQIANCTDKDVTALTEAIHHSSIRIYKHVMGIYTKAGYSLGPNAEVMQILSGASDDFFSGKNSLEGLGAMVGTTQAVYQKVTDNGNKVGQYDRELAKIYENWFTMLEGYNVKPPVPVRIKKKRVIGEPLAKRIANTLYRTLSRHNALDSELAILSIAVLHNCSN